MMSRKSERHRQDFGEITGVTPNVGVFLPLMGQTNGLVLPVSYRDKE